MTELYSTFYMLTTFQNSYIQWNVNLELPAGGNRQLRCEQFNTGITCTRMVCALETSNQGRGERVVRDAMLQSSQGGSINKFYKKCSRLP